MNYYRKSCIVFIVPFWILASGCGDAAPGLDDSFGRYEPRTQAGRTVEKITEIHIRFAGEAIETASAYVDPGLIARSAARGAVDPSVDPEDIFEKLTGNETRLLPGRGGGVRRLTLKDELSELERRKHRELAANAPEFHELERFDGIDVDIGSHTVAIGDQLLDGRTVSGAAAIEILKARLGGESIQAIVKDLDALAAPGASTGRGFYLNNTRRWPGGVVLYQLAEGMSPKLRRDFKKIAAEWSGKTDVEFVEADTYWGRISAAFFGGALVTVTEIPSSDRSSSTVGADAGKLARIRLKRGAKLNTIRHETGHAIGLKHEHQRPDRDEYISGDFSQDPGSNSIIHEIFHRLETTWRRQPVHSRGLLVRVTTPVVRWVEDTHNRASKQYDYFSVMHYRWAAANFPFRALKSQTAKIDINGVPTTRTVNPGDELDTIAKQYISPLDIQAVNSMYGK